MRTRNVKKWLAIAAAVGGLAAVAPHARADTAPQQASQRYSVTWTEGTNLIVTDNANNTLYYYTVDKNEPAGSQLKLRGTLDLNKIGQQTITPRTFNAPAQKPGS